VDGWTYVRRPTYVRTDGHLRPTLLGRLKRADLKINHVTLTTPIVKVVHVLCKRGRCGRYCGLICNRGVPEILSRGINQWWRRLQFVIQMLHAWNLQQTLWICAVRITSCLVDCRCTSGVQRLVCITTTSLRSRGDREWLFWRSHSLSFHCSQFPLPSIAIPKFEEYSHSHIIPTGLLSFPPIFISTQHIGLTYFIESILMFNNLCIIY